MELNHTIVPSIDKQGSATFFARIFGLRYDGPSGHFAPVQVNDALTLDFNDATEFDSHHLASKVSGEEFDAVFGRIQAEGIPYGSGPYSLEDMKTNSWRGGRGVYSEIPMVTCWNY